MPNTKPATTTLSALAEKKQIARIKSVVDFGIYAGITDGNISSVPELASQCSGFKIYLGGTTNAEMLSASRLPEVLPSLATSKKLTLIHAELQSCLEQHKKAEASLSDHVQAHPSLCEEAALKQILSLAQNSQARLHICHLSSSGGVELMKKRPSTMSVGVTPHHLLFEYENVQTQQTWYKVNPPIRSHQDHEALWQNMVAGVIDVVESDHAPHALDEKNQEFNNAPSGLPGVETMYPLLLARVKQDRLSFQRLLPLICEKPAGLLGIPKGKIEVGKDADLLVIDFKTMQPITAENLHSKCGWTPFEGWPALFPEIVFLRGETAVEDDELLVKQGCGRFIEATHA
jgi:dihydroorotase